MSRFYISTINPHKNVKTYKNERRFRNESAFTTRYLRNMINNGQNMDNNRRIKIAAALQRMVYVVFALFLVLFFIYLIK